MRRKHLTHDLCHCWKLLQRLRLDRAAGPGRFAEPVALQLYFGAARRGCKILRGSLTVLLVDELPHVCWHVQGSPVFIIKGVEPMKDFEQNTCAHIPCTCGVGAGERYCSDFCRDAGSEEVEIACECGHATCSLTAEEEEVA